MNILSVSHQQELRYSGLEAVELTEAVLVTTLDLAVLAADPSRREVRAEAAVTAAGEVSALVYWWTLDYGWSVKETTRECDIYNQARENIFHSSHLSPGVSLIYDLAYDSGMLQSELFTSSQNLVLAKLPSSGFWRYGQFFK